MIDHHALARELYDAEQNAHPVELITQRHPDLTWDDARAIAHSTDDIRRSAGEVQIGWKLGWTSEAMRTALGIDRTNWGTLWQRQLIGNAIESGGLIHPKIEPELVWRSPQDLAGDVSAEDVQQVGGEWALGLELVDPRFPSFSFDALDNTADNSSSAAIAVGSFHRVDELPKLEAIEAEFSNGAETRPGAGSQAMGSPWEAVAWLVRSLSSEGLSLRTGEIVFTGGLTAPFDALAGSTYTLTASGLGPVVVAVS